MKLKPLHDWAVIIPSEPEAKTAGGIYVPDTAKEKPAEGMVEAIGPGAYEEEKYGKKKQEKKERKFVPTTVKPGDRVMYEKYAGHTVMLNGTERILVRERNILGVLPAASAGGSKPLQIPERTTTSGETSLAALGLSTVAPAPAAKVVKPAAKAAQKAAKKTAKQAPKKAAKKTAKKKPGKR